MITYDSFPTWNAFLPVLEKMVEDRNSSYDPTAFYIDYATMNAAREAYTDSEFKALTTFLEDNRIPTRTKPNGYLWSTFDYVYQPAPDFSLPSRGTPGSAGYDLYLPCDVEIDDTAPVKIKLGVRWYTNDNNEFLLIRPRSKFAGILDLQCSGVIDADYAFNPETNGEISVVVRVYPGMGKLSLKKGERICQGIIMRYGKVGLDVPRAKERIGGFGSTDRQEDANADIEIAEIVEE